MKYWLLKSEADAWSWDNQVKEGASMWDGVRNYQARNYLKEMKKNDLCFFYHSVTERSIIGIVKVVKEYYPDPTDKTERFVVVDVKATKKLKNPVSLDQIKNNTHGQFFDYGLGHPTTEVHWLEAAMIYNYIQISQYKF